MWTTTTTVCSSILETIRFKWHVCNIVWDVFQTCMRTDNSRPTYVIRNETAFLRTSRHLDKKVHTYIYIEWWHTDSISYARTSRDARETNENKVLSCSDKGGVATSVNLRKMHPWLHLKSTEQHKFTNIPC